MSLQRHSVSKEYIRCVVGDLQHLQHTHLITPNQLNQIQLIEWKNQLTCLVALLIPEKVVLTAVPTQAFLEKHPEHPSILRSIGNLSHITSYHPPHPLYNDLLWEPQGEKVPLPAFLLKRIPEMTIGIMCTFPRWNGRFLIAIITTNIVQCFWTTDNGLGVIRSLNSRFPNLQLMSETPWLVLACPLEWKTQDTLYFLTQSLGDLGKLS